jgi:hypothetical protein
MHIPKAWAKATADAKAQDGKQLALAVWGWGEDAVSARSEAVRRLERIIGRIRRGESFPSDYAYATRPPREEILQSFAPAPDDAPFGLVTRNRYGALVLNAARLLFLDVDLPRPTFGERLKRIFLPSSPTAESVAVGKLRDALRQFGKATFRLYRTASGLRAIALDRDFDPAGQEAQELMKSTGTDPWFVRLCVAQKSFRARLTPKPWRCGCPLPPAEYPRTDEADRKAFAAWLSNYESISSRYATCRYLETIGAGSPRGDAKKLIALHDQRTRCNETLTLA